MKIIKQITDCHKKYHGKHNVEGLLQGASICFGLKGKAAKLLDLPFYHLIFHYIVDLMICLKDRTFCSETFPVHDF